MNLRKIALTLVTVSSMLMAQSAMAQIVEGQAAGVTAGTLGTTVGGTAVVATMVAGIVVWQAVTVNSGTKSTIATVKKP